MAQEPKHIGVPQPFELGDVIEWLHHFNNCAKANGLNNAKKPLKPPTLLEAEALAIWLDLQRKSKQIIL